MPSASSPRPPAKRSGAPFPAALAAGAIVLAALAAYRGSFSGPLVLDDTASIADNATIRHLWPVWRTLQPPAGGLPVSGRPIVNFTLALNYALGGTAVGGYHVVNLAIHILAGLTLFGVARRLFERPPIGLVRAAPAALAVALLWTVHPLQTAAVTYISQRAESLMGLFFLQTLYWFLRWNTLSPPPPPLRQAGPARWSGRRVEKARWGPVFASLRRGRRRAPPLLSFFFCACGMATKETMVSAPLIVLLCDRTFFAGTLREAWRRRRGFYLALAATWLPLILLAAKAGNRGGTAGFGSSVDWWVYAIAQGHAIVHYLHLAVWPASLVFHYGAAVWASTGELVVDAAVVLLLAAGSVYALIRGTALGFAGAFFFAVLAPSSSIVPVSTEVMAEHRMYLPLAAVIAIVVLAVRAGWRRASALSARWVLPTLAAAASAALAGTTARRNDDYRSVQALWADTAAKVPENAAAWSNLGNAFAESGRWAQAAVPFQTAVRLRPQAPEFRYNLGNVLARGGRLAEGIAQLEEAVRLQPGYAEARSNLGNAYAAAGRFEDAIGQYQAVLRKDPGRMAVHVNLGNALLRTGRTAEAIDQYEAALKLDPGNAQLHYNLGVIFRALNRSQDAETQFGLARRAAR